MQEHYRDCPSRLAWEKYERKKAKEAERKRQEQLSHIPVYTNGGDYVASAAIPGMVISQKVLDAQAAYQSGTDEYRKRKDDEDITRALADLRKQGGGVLMCKDGTTIDKDGKVVGRWR
jgi:hypothetical protein